MIPANFAKDCEFGWNSHDLNYILRHYAEGVVFRSRKAIPKTGQGILHGKSSLAQYWRAALDRQPNLKFSVQQVFIGHDSIVITYRNHAGLVAAET